MRRSILATVLVLCVAGTSCSGERSGPLIVDDLVSGPADYEYVIPAGTGDRIAAGDPVAILPAELDVRVGERIRIVNEDDRGHFVGIFFVGAGETVTQQFATAGEFIGNCTVHPSGEIRLRVKN